MTITELLEQIEKVHHERTLEAHHDDMFFQTYPDVEAIERIINLLEFLSEKKPSDKVTVAELWKVAEIDS